jgi:DNA-binding winged helix-turn-helix (wHTH) protein/TolB-like protein/Flp pilus assembly protein TadD
MGGPVVFGPYTFDPEARELHKDGRPIRLQDQPARILLSLLERSGQIVTREELRRRLWPDGTFVDFEQNLNKAVTKLRDALQDDADHPRFIETLPRRGYRFIAPVETPSGERPASTSRRPLLVGASVALAALAAVSIWLFLASRPVPITAIAVLPFSNISSDSSLDSEADAFTEATISRLAQAPAFDRVISRTSVARYREAGKRLDQIARELRVDVVVEGALGKSGDDILATVRLLQAQPERTVWSQSYRRKAREVLALQSDIALDILVQAHAHLVPADRERIGRWRNVDPQAYSAFARGAPMCGHWFDSDWAAGVSLLKEAVRLEPAFPEALAALAFCQWHQVNKGGQTPAQGCPAARASAQRAIELDSNLPEAHAAMTIIRMSCDWDWQGAGLSSQRAIQLAPNSTTVAYARAIYLMVIGRMDESLAVSRHAMDSEPGAPFPAHLFSVSLMLAGRLEESLREFHAVTRMDTGNPWPFFQKSLILTRLHRLDEARREWLTGRALMPPGKNHAADYWAMPYQVAAGDVAGARRTTEAWIARSAKEWVDPFVIADMYSAQGDAARALDYLELAYRVRSPALFWLKVEAILAPLRSEPRYVALLQKLNFPE